jgi:hypothetical protein
MIVTSVPANGQSISLSSTIIRSDANDGLKKLLAFATSTSQQPSYTTYFAHALPYVSLATTFGQQVYDTFAQHQEKFLNDQAPTTLSPASTVHPDKLDLQDGYLVQYSGPNHPGDYTDLYVDNSDLRWTANDSYLRGTATWILYNIHKYTRRTDYPDRPWYKEWTKALGQAATGAIDAGTLKGIYQKDVILLQSDDDLTAADQKQYVTDFTSDYNTAVAAISGHHLNELKNAILSASKAVVFLQNGKNGTSAVSTPDPTALTPGAQGVSKVLVPGKLAAAMKQ